MFFFFILNNRPISIVAVYKLGLPATRVRSCRRGKTPLHAVTEAEFFVRGWYVGSIVVLRARDGEGDGCDASLPLLVRGWRCCCAQNQLAAAETRDPSGPLVRCQAVTSSPKERSRPIPMFTPDSRLSFLMRGIFY